MTIAAAMTIHIQVSMGFAYPDRQAPNRPRARGR
jgi:hypothetical protein